MEELTIAIEELRLRLHDQSWFIPVRLDECDIPDRSIGSGDTLESIQRIGLFGDHTSNLEKLVRALKKISNK